LIIYHFTLIIDGSFKGMEAVTPAKAGVQKCLFSWIPAFAGMTEKGLLELLTSPSMMKCTMVNVK